MATIVPLDQLSEIRIELARQRELAAELDVDLADLLVQQLQQYRRALREHRAALAEACTGHEASWSFYDRPYAA